MRSGITKRLISLFMTVLLCASLFPVEVYADAEEEVSTHTHTQAAAPEEGISEVGETVSDVKNDPLPEDVGDSYTFTVEFAGEDGVAGLFETHTASFDADGSCTYEVPETRDGYRLNPEVTRYAPNAEGGVDEEVITLTADGEGKYILSWNENRDVRYVVSYVQETAEKPYTFTVEFVGEDGAQLFGTENASFGEGEAYSFVLPEVRDGYRLNPESVVRYTANDEGGEDAVNITLAANEEGKYVLSWNENRSVRYVVGYVQEAEKPYTFTVEFVDEYGAKLFETESFPFGENESGTRELPETRDGYRLSPDEIIRYAANAEGGEDEEAITLTADEDGKYLLSWNENRNVRFVVNYFAMEVDYTVFYNGYEFGTGANETLLYAYTGNGKTGTMTSAPVDAQNLMETLQALLSAQEGKTGQELADALAAAVQAGYTEKHDITPFLTAICGDDIDTLSCEQIGAYLAAAIEGKYSLDLSKNDSSDADFVIKVQGDQPVEKKLIYDDTPVMKVLDCQNTDPDHIHDDSCYISEWEDDVDIALFTVEFFAQVDEQAIRVAETNQVLMTVGSTYTVTLPDLKLKGYVLDLDNIYSYTAGEGGKEPVLRGVPQVQRQLQRGDHRGHGGGHSHG